MEALVDYSWPGNIRELQNCLNYALVKSRGGRIMKAHLSLPGLAVDDGYAADSLRRSIPAGIETSAPPATVKKIYSENEADGVSGEERGGITIFKGLDKGETVNILKKYRGSITKAAREIGVSRATLYRFMKKNNIGLK